MRAISGFIVAPPIAPFSTLSKLLPGRNINSDLSLRKLRCRGTFAARERWGGAIRDERGEEGSVVSRIKVENRPGGPFQRSNSTNWYFFESAANRLLRRRRRVRPREGESQIKKRMRRRRRRRRLRGKGNCEASRGRWKNGRQKEKARNASEPLDTVLSPGLQRERERG